MSPGWPYPATVTVPQPSADNVPESADPTAPTWADAPSPEPAAPAAPAAPWSRSATINSSTGTFPSLDPAGIRRVSPEPPAPAGQPYGAPTYAGGPGFVGSYPGSAAGPAVPWREGPEDTTWALLAHLSYFAFAIIGPLVIMFTKGRRSAFVRDQAVEALNLHISLVTLAAACVVLFLLMVPLIVLAAVLLAGAALAVIGAVAASRGVAYRYPLNIRLVR
jgi:uncharacterized Tic20 family protein